MNCKYSAMAHIRWLMARMFYVLISVGAFVGIDPLAQAQYSNITRVSSFEYDADGLLVKEVVEPDSPQDCLSTTYSYDAYGNQQTVSTAVCAGAVGTALASADAARTSSSIFAAQTVVIGGISYFIPEGTFGTSSTNALGQSETREFDPRFGAMTKLVGPNGGTTTWAYDPFGRKTEERRADGTYTRWEYRFCGMPQTDGGAAPCAADSSIGGHSLAWYAVEASYAGNGALLAPKKLQIHDALDRVVRVQTQDFHDQVVVQDTHYTSLGEVLQRSNPYRLQGGAPAWIRFQYDDIGRPVREEVPDSDAPGAAAVTTFGYGGLVITVTNAAGQTRTTHKNAAGQVAKVVDHLGGELVYSYDALGQLIQTNAAGAITKIGYSQRGQKAWMEDPAMGRWEYEYNAFGEMVRQTDGLGRSSTRAYDMLGRMTERAEPDLLSTWHYDKKADGSSCGAGVGKLCEARANNGYERIHTYDALGRPTVTGTRLDSSATAATMGQTYDPVTGRLASKTWPTGYKAEYSYTAGGYVSKVVGGGVAGHSQTVTFEVLAMNAQGAITQYRQGNDITTVKDVDDSTGKLRSVQATLAGQASGNVLHHSYGYDALGNLKTRSDASTGVNESFQYDALNRLGLYTAVGGELPGAQSTQVLYDAAGNIRYKSDAGYYHYDPARPNRLTQITQEPAAGWTAAGAVTAANTGTRRLSYAFDDDRPGAKTVNGTALGNGNLWYTVSQDDANGRHTVRWQTYTSFDMPREIFLGDLTQPANPTATTADRTLSFVYGPEHQRVRQDVQLSANAPSHLQAGTTWYYNGADSQGLAYEKEVRANGTTEHKHYVDAGGITFALYVKREGHPDGKSATSIAYFHHDHLGSIAAVSNEAGAVVERMAYDPWGKRRLPNGTSDTLDALYGASTERGYTLHEHLDEMGLIHMNGRVFDPLVGRFMSADPNIQYPDNLQSHNRYAYVLNNPLLYTDPSGYFRFKLKRVVRVATAIVVAVYAPHMIYSAWAGSAAAAATAAGTTLTSAQVTGMWIGSNIAAGGISGAVSSGSLRGTVSGALTAGLMYGAGSIAPSGFGNVVAHAAVGCVGSAAGVESVKAAPLPVRWVASSANMGQVSKISLQTLLLTR
ncbi:RHS repeat-associated core domain-containing protein [Comamonas endophytica]|uniref:RHS repeat-associated core domain-containing protein n=1 Tax=Comamonas endophytica TaxID=2949090 RepID=UPI0036105F08